MICDQYVREKIKVSVNLLVSFSFILFNMIKLPYKTFVIELLLKLMYSKKSIATFLCDFIYSKVMGTSYLRELILAMKISRFYICMTPAQKYFEDFCAQF